MQNEAVMIADRSGGDENPGGFQHIPALDGVRGLAILLVLIDHLFWSSLHTGSHIMDLIEQLRNSAYCGVNLFFALSGFLITGILIDTLGVRHYFRTFYARRALRIFPLYYGALLALLLLTRPFHFHWNGWQYYFFTYTQNIALWRTSVPLDLAKFNINQFWSLQVEEQFYFIWPVVIFFVKKPASLVRIALSAALLVFLIRTFMVLMAGHPHFKWLFLPYTPTFCCADNLLFGCALSAALRTPARATILRAAPWCFAAGMALLTLTFFLYGGLDWRKSAFVPTVGFTLFGITAASLVATTLKPQSRAQRIFSGSALRFFGRYSYGLYVYHASIESYLSPHIRRAVLNTFHSRPLAVLSSAMAVGVLSTLAAVLSYHLFEVHILRLKRFFRYQKSRQAEPVPV